MAKASRITRVLVLVLVLVCLSLHLSLSSAYIPSIPPISGLSPAQTQPQNAFSHGSPLFLNSQNRVQLTSILEKNPLEKYHRQNAVAKTTKESQPPTGQHQNNHQQEQEQNQQKQQRRQSCFITGSAALAGFTDVLCLAKYGCFVNMMTGNMLKLTTALANSKSLSITQVVSSQDVWLPASFILSYMIGIILFGQIQETTRNAISSNINNSDEATAAAEAKAVLVPLRFVAPIVALLFLGADVLAGGAGAVANSAAQKAIQVPLLAMGFGLINGAAGHASDNTIFFAMTGHLTKATHCIRKWMLTATATKSQAGVWNPDAATKKSLKILRSFLGGALTAALMLRVGSTGSMSRFFPPVCSTLGLLYASLFAWYAPPQLPQVAAKTAAKLQQQLSNAFARLRNPGESYSEQSPSRIQGPVLVDFLPSVTAQDFLYPAADDSTAAFQPGSNTGFSQMM